MVCDLVGKEWTTLSNSIDNELKGLSTKTVMPSGDVSMFDGLNTDSNGHVHSSIMYSTLRDCKVDNHPITADVPKTNARFASLPLHFARATASSSTMSRDARALPVPKPSSPL